MTTPHISKLTLESFAGKSRSHDFAPGVNLITGSNGKGKTTICNAIAFTLTGRVPGLPATNPGLMAALGSGLRMGASVMVEQQKSEGSSFFAEWATYDRALIRSGKSVKGEAKCPAPADLVPPTMLDLEPFLNASPKVRAGMIMQACGGDIYQQLLQLGHESGLEKALGQRLKWAEEGLQEWMEKIEEAIKTTASGLTANIKSMRGTLEGMETLEDSTPLLPPAGPSVADLRAKVIDLEKQVSTLEGEARAIASRPTPVQPAGERPNGTPEVFLTQLTAAQKDLAQAQAAHATASTVKGMWDRWNAKQASLEEVLATAQATFNAVDTEIGEEVKNTAMSTMEKREEELQQFVYVASDALASAQRNSLTGKEECPCCRAKKEHWQVEAADAGQLATLEADSKTAALNLSQHRQAMAVKKRHLALAELAIRAHDAIEEHEHDKPSEAAPVLDSSAVEEAQESVASLNAAAKLAAAWQAYDDAMSQHTPAQERLNQINFDVAVDTANLQDAQAALASAELAQAARQQAEARQHTRHQAEKRLADLEAEELAFKAARDKWQAGVQGVMDTAMRDILRVCETFTAGLFPSPLTVHNLELGFYQNATWIPIDAFSGSDRRVACAAIQAALAVRHQGFKLAIIDEATTIDPERLPKVLANLVKSVEGGLIHQAMVMVNTSIQDIPSEVNIITLE